MSAIRYLLWLTSRNGIQPLIVVKLVEQFGSAAAVYYAPKEEYDLLPLPKQLKGSLREKSMDDVDRILERCDRQGIHLVGCSDGDYPERLLQLPDYPLVLYVKGRLPRVDDEVVIAMVGARNCTPYGISMAGQISMDLARSGAIVVSGLAQGIDAASIKGALQGGGRVISILAGGVDVVYPACNRWLYDDVAVSGAIVSENPPGTRPEGWRFPIRNRLISGISLGTIAVEAAEGRSGTLITAHTALDQGRDVFAVPGPADAPMSGGTNQLISRGEAKLVRCAWDVLSEYTDMFPHKLRQAAPLSREEANSRLSVGRKAEAAPPREKQRNISPEGAELPLLPEAELLRLGEEQREILRILCQTPLTVDEMIGQTEIPARRVNTALTLLQAHGYLKELPGRRFMAAVRFDQDQ